MIKSEVPAAVAAVFTQNKVVAAPVIIWQVWWFVSPGLHPHERRFVLPMILATSSFFLMGVGVALFSLPLFMRILLGLTGSELHYLPLADNLFGFILLITIAFGLVFELPVAIFVMGIGLTYGPRLLYWPIRLYSDCLRGIPLLVLIFFVYYALPLSGWNVNNFWAAVGALAFLSPYRLRRF